MLLTFPNSNDIDLTKKEKVTEPYGIKKKYLFLMENRHATMMHVSVDNMKKTAGKRQRF